MLRMGAKGRHAAMIRGLQVPVPFDLSQFVAGLERQRGRPIGLHSFSFGPGGLCGLWIGTAEADYIYHEAGTTPFHATHIALHEIAHMLLGHQHTAAWDQLISLLARPPRAAIGAEQQWHQRMAGLWTTVLVALGAALSSSTVGDRCWPAAGTQVSANMYKQR